jgi:ribonuclease HI
MNFIEECEQLKKPTTSKVDSHVGLLLLLHKAGEFVKIFSDGSVRGNKGTWCVIIQKDGMNELFSGIEQGEQVDSSRMELIGLSFMIPKLLSSGKVKQIDVYTDSLYIDINLRYYNRKRKKKNMDLFIPIYSALRKYKPNLKVRYVYGKEKLLLPEHVRCHKECSRLHKIKC